MSGMMDLPTQEANGPVCKNLVFFFGVLPDPFTIVRKKRQVLREPGFNDHEFDKTYLFVFLVILMILIILLNSPDQDCFSFPERRDPF